MCLGNLFDASYKVLFDVFTRLFGFFFNLDLFNAVLDKTLDSFFFAFYTNFLEFFR